MNVYEKIAKVRVDLQNLKLTKSGKNKFAGYDYFQLKDFVSALNKLMQENGLFTNFSIHENEATLTIINCEKPEDQVVFTSPIAEASLKGCTPIQCLGGVHTYMHRYLLQNAFNIVEDDMIDASNPADRKVSRPITQEQYETIDAIANDKTYAYIKRKFGKDDLFSLTEDEASEIISKINGTNK